LVFAETVAAAIHPCLLPVMSALAAPRDKQLVCATLLAAPLPAACYRPFRRIFARSPLRASPELPLIGEWQLFWRDAKAAAAETLASHPHELGWRKHRCLLRRTVNTGYLGCR
jgi:hypothetical protein